TGAEVRCLRGHEDTVTSVTYSFDGRWVMSGSVDHTVRVWDARTGAEVRCLRGHEDTVTSVTYSFDGRWVMSGSVDHTVRVWDARTGAEVRCLRGHEDTVTSVVCSPNGLWTVTGSRDGTVRAWTVHTGTQRRCLLGKANEIGDVSVSPDGRRIAAAASRSSLIVWGAASGAELLRFGMYDEDEAIYFGSHFTSVAYCSGGRRLVSGDGENRVRIWDAYTGEELHRLRGHEEHVCSVAISPNGQLIASASYDQTVRLWNTEGDEAAPVIDGLHMWKDRTIVYTPDARHIITGEAASSKQFVAGEPSCIRIWDADDAVEVGRIQYGEGPTVREVAVSPDGSWIAGVSTGEEATAQSGALSAPSSSATASMRTWDAVTRQQLLHVRAHCRVLFCVAVSSNGRLVAAGGGDREDRPGFMQIWHAGSGADYCSIHGHEEAVICLALSPDGRQIASASWDRTIRVWDLETAEEVHRLDVREGLVAGLAYSDDSRRLVCCTRDDRVRIWDIASGQCLSVLRGFGDTRAIAAGPQAFPFRALCRGGVTAIEDSGSGEVVAWYAAAFSVIASRPGGKGWAGIWEGTQERHFDAVALEGHGRPST
ncbi:hypothetical protein ACFL09_00225, partial [Planctomycetota bacterium]